MAGRWPRIVMDLTLDAGKSDLKFVWKDRLLGKGKSILSIKTLFLVFAMIPVIALVLITVNLAVGSTEAINTLGLRLFSNSFSLGTESPNMAPALMQYGILPALWGTLLVVLIAMLFAFPVSLTLAILANDFSVGFLSSIIRWVNGVLSGIPPIIYALMGTTFFLWFFWPKFAGKGLSAETSPVLPHPGMLPSDSSCTLLGGLMLALLIIPFMTPLLDDAIHSVPVTLKEASLSLGANRWYTLKSISLPFALPGILNAALLGILTALGESIIVAYTIGFGAKALPVPLYDVLERIAPLTSVIASLEGGGFSRATMVGPVGQSVASFMGLLLLFTAFVILGATFYLQKRIRKRLTL